MIVSHKLFLLMVLVLLRITLCAGMVLVASYSMEVWVSEEP